ncbi:MAG: tetraacyldisaccharide 4'-kinase [Rikenellaceae bacterium]|nr:tetraacyldisaccharide 4'-kinase [Rikenellaceae bacterium]
MAKSNPWFAPLAWLYKMAITLRHRLFDWGILPTVRFDIPIVCIGNITVGGTGKTPMAEMVLGHLSQTHKVALISRGYGRKTKGYIEVQPDMHYIEVGDEPKMIKLKFPDVPIVVCEDRVAGIKRLREEHPEVEVVVMDDGFQHRYVEAQINIIMVDYTRPVYEDKFLPEGQLRDLPSQLYRAQYFIVTKCNDDLTPIERRLLKKDFLKYPYQSLYMTGIESGAPVPLFPADAPASVEYGADVVAMAGVGNPNPFLAGLRKHYNVIEELVYDDHHVYRRSDLQTMLDAAGERGVIVTTEKDAVKLVNPDKIPAQLRAKLYYIPISITFIGSSPADFLLNLEKDVRTN